MQAGITHGICSAVGAFSFPRLIIAINNKNEKKKEVHGCHVFSPNKKLNASCKLILTDAMLKQPIDTRME